MPRRIVVFALSASLVVAGCLLDWNRLDRRLGEGGAAAAAGGATSSTTSSTVGGNGSGGSAVGGSGGSITEVWGDATGSDHPGTVEDTFINLNAEVNAGLLQLNLYTWPTNQLANAILMKWDVSAIPSGAKVSSATLSLYVYEVVGVPYETSVHAIVGVNPIVALADGYTYDGVNGWTPNACCDGNVPLAQADIGPAVDTQDLDATNDAYLSWDVTPLVTAWVSDATSNHGLLINSDPVSAGDDRRTFRSSEHATATERPKLTVTYAP